MQVDRNQLGLENARLRERVKANAEEVLILTAENARLDNRIQEIGAAYEELLNERNRLLKALVGLVSIAPETMPMAVWAERLADARVALSPNEASATGGNDG
jgi:hypothetical protein